MVFTTTALTHQVHYWDLRTQRRRYNKVKSRQGKNHDQTSHKQANTLARRSEQSEHTWNAANNLNSLHFGCVRTTLSTAGQSGTMKSVCKLWWMFTTDSVALPWFFLFQIGSSNLRLLDNVNLINWNERRAKLWKEDLNYNKPGISLNVPVD